jgi:hypothetical protein
VGLNLENVRHISAHGIVLEGVHGAKLIVDHCEKLEADESLGG